MTTAILCTLIGLFLGGGVGFLIGGVLAMEKYTDPDETVQRQARIIEKQSVIIAGLHKQIDEYEDDLK